MKRIGSVAVPIAVTLIKLSVTLGATRISKFGGMVMLIIVTVIGVGPAPVGLMHTGEVTVLQMPCVMVGARIVDAQGSGFGHGAAMGTATGGQD